LQVVHHLSPVLQLLMQLLNPYLSSSGLGLQGLDLVLSAHHILLMIVGISSLAPTYCILLTKLLVHVDQRRGVAEREGCPDVVVGNHVVQVAVHSVCISLSSLILQRNHNVGSIHNLSIMLLRELLNGLSSSDLPGFCQLPTVDSDLPRVPFQASGASR